MRRLRLPVYQFGLACACGDVPASACASAVEGLSCARVCTPAHTHMNTHTQAHMQAHMQTHMHASKHIH